MARDMRFQARSVARESIPEREAERRGAPSASRNIFDTGARRIAKGVRLIFVSSRDIGNNVN